MIVQFKHEKRVTKATVFAEPGTLLEPMNIVGHGEAKCRKDDVFSPAVGELIALGRAQQDFGRQVEEIGHFGVVSFTEAERVLTSLIGYHIEIVR